MTMDNTVVPPVAAPPVQQTTPPAVNPTVPPTAPEPLTLDKVQAMIAEATAKAVAEAKDIGRRELQSQQDKNRAEVARITRQARIAESTLKATQDSLSKLDPDAAKDVELARLRAREQGMTGAEQEEAATKAQQEFHQAFMGTLNQFVTSLGLDPKDPRLDWAGDAPNYLEAQRRVLESAAKIQKDKNLIAQSAFEKRLKAIEDKTKGVENREANSVQTTSSGGVVTASDKDFLAKFGSGELPMTKENMDRYNKITKTYS